MIPAGLSLFFRNAAQLLTLSGRPVPRRGPDLGELGVIPDGAVLTRGAIIVGVGRTRDLAAEARRLRARAIDCRGRVVMPGFVDSHTHLVFAGSRVDDFEERLRAKTYEEIAASGGGITLSARLLGEASTRQLCARACHFLDQLAAHGTTTVEVKTGYGLSLAIELDAASADHLDHVNRSDIRALARSGVVATLVPGANFHLGLGTYPPARRLIEAGAAVALATDFNPGTSPTVNMQFILSLACSAMRMTPAEALSAATINAAYSLRRADRLGSLQPGKQADLAVMDVDDYRKIPYYFAWNHCVMTVKRGRIIYARESAWC